MPGASDTLSASERTHRWRWWALAGASLAVFMSALDSNVVNVALPIMAGQFRVTADIRWVSLSYLLPTTALLGAFGALSDVLGRKRIMLAGVIVFVVGSILCGTARSLTQMILYRALQGIGGSCIGATILAIATVSFAPEERGRAMAVVGLIAPLGAVVGPSVGGLLIGAFGWPSIFFINVPFGLLAFVLVARLLAHDSPPGIKTFDFGGAALFAVALVLLLLGLSPVNGRLTVTDLVLLAAAVAAAAGLGLVERRAANPLIPIPMVRRARFSIPLSGILTFPFVGAGLGFIMAFFLEDNLHMGPAQAGLTLLFFPLAMAAASQVGGRLSDRFHPRLPAAVGAAISLVGVALILPLDPRWTSFDVGLRLAIAGLGAGFFVAPSSVAVMAATPPEHLGVGSALVNTARFMGFALAPAIATVFWRPGLQGAADLSAMRTVAIILTAAQAATLATVLAYRVRRGEGTQKRSMSTGSAAA